MTETGDGSPKVDFSLSGGLPQPLRIGGRDDKVYEISDDVALGLLGEIVNWRERYSKAMSDGEEMPDEDKLYELTAHVLGIDTVEARGLGNTACIGFLGFLVNRQAEKHLAMRQSRLPSESALPLKEPST